MVIPRTCWITNMREIYQRHSNRGENHHRWSYSSSLRSPWWGGSSSPSGLRACTSSYVFDISLVFLIWHDLYVPRALLVYLDLMVFFPLYLHVINWVLLFEVRYVGLSIGFENTWCMSCMWIPMVTMGCSIDSLDVCFGTRLADFRGDIGVIYA